MSASTTDPLDFALGKAGIPGHAKDLVGKTFRFFGDIKGFAPEPGESQDDLFAADPAAEALPLLADEESDEGADGFVFVGTVYGLAFDEREGLLIISIPATMVDAEVVNTISYDLSLNRWSFGSFECEQYEDHSTIFEIL